MSIFFCYTNKTTFLQQLLKNAVFESAFRSPEAEEEKNRIQALKREVELLELKNRQLQDVTTEIKGRITTLKQVRSSL